MKRNMIALMVLMMVGLISYAQQPITENKTPAIDFNPEQQQLVNLSKQKWNWMSEKNTDSLTRLFDEKSMFVHMGGTWGKDREIEVIKSGNIWYKKAAVYSVVVNIIGNTAIILSDLDLEAVVGGNAVVNPFMVTEVYVRQNNNWKMGSLTFSRLLGPVKMSNSGQ